MTLLNFIFKNRTFGILSIIILLISGIISITILPTRFMPPMALPRIKIVTFYNMALAEEIESRVTKPIEEAMMTIPGFSTSRSISKDELSIIEVQFDWGHDLTKALVEVRKSIDEVQNQLPREVSTPLISRHLVQGNGSFLLKINNIGLSAIAFQNWIENSLQNDLLRVKGIRSVKLQGLEKQELKINLFNNLQESTALTPQSINALLEQQHFIAPGGEIEDNENTIPVKVDNRIDSLRKLKQTTIPLESGELTLDSVAKVNIEAAEKENFILINHKPAVLAVLFEDPDVNIFTSEKNLLKKINEINQGNENKYQIELEYSEAKTVGNSIQSLLMSLFIGLFLSYWVLCFFMKDFFRPVIIILAIPLSLVLIVFAMYLLNIQINLMSLGGLALSSGMLLDNAIVIISTISLAYREGQVNIQKILERVSAVSKALTSSVLTSLAVFVPVLFLQGLIAEIFMDMALIICISLLSTWVVSQVVIPFLYIQSLETFPRIRENLQKKKNIRLAGRSARFFAMNIGLSQKYPLFKILILFIILLPLVFLLLFKSRLLPEIDMKQLSFAVSLENTSSLERLETFAYELESKLAFNKNTKVFLYGGVDKSDLPDYESHEGQHVLNGLVLINKGSSKKIKKQIEEGFFTLSRDYLDMTYRVDMVKPEFYKLLESALEKDKWILSANTRSKLREFESRNDFELYREKDFMNIYRINIDQRKAAMLQLDASTIAQQVFAYFEGLAGIELELEGSSIPVRTSVSDLGKSMDEISIKTRDNKSVPIKAIASLSGEKREMNYRRINSLPVIYYPTTMRWQAEKSLSEETKAKGLKVVQSRLDEELERSQKNFIISFIISLFLVYIIIATLFDDFLMPLAILFCVLPSLLLALSLSLVIDGQINLFHLIGLLILLGSSVNNSILLLDVYKRKKNYYMAIRSRIDSMILSTATTCISLFPLLLQVSQGNEMNRAVALVLFAGLFFSFFTSPFLLFGLLTPRAKP